MGKCVGVPVCQRAPYRVNHVGAEAQIKPTTRGHRCLHQPVSPSQGTVSNRGQTHSTSNLSPLAQQGHGQLGGEGQQTRRGRFCSGTGSVRGVEGGVCGGDQGFGANVRQGGGAG